jgi:hypothetical protein
MFTFGHVTGEDFTFLQTDKGHTYTYSSEELAREYFKCVEDTEHLYQLTADLSVAMLVKAGDSGEAPKEVVPTEKQKIALWSSYVYKSHLAWTPFPEEVRPCTD